MLKQHRRSLKRRLSLAAKDAGLVLEAAGRCGLHLAIAQAAERLTRAIELGHGDEDMAATYFATAEARIRASLEVPISEEVPEPIDERWRRRLTRRLKQQDERGATPLRSNVRSLSACTR